MSRKYVCVNKCYFQDTLYAPGSILELQGGHEQVPSHFKALGNTDVKPVEPKQAKQDAKPVKQIEKSKGKKARDILE